MLQNSNKTDQLVKLQGHCTTVLQLYANVYIHKLNYPNYDKFCINPLLPRVT